MVKVRLRKYMPVLLCWVNICLQLVECYSNSLLGSDEAALDFLIVTWDAASADNTLITNFKSVRTATNAKVPLGDQL